MDLVLKKTFKGWYAIKIQPTNQPTYIVSYNYSINQLSFLQFLKSSIYMIAW